MGRTRKDDDSTDRKKREKKMKPAKKNAPQKRKEGSKKTRQIVNADTQPSEQSLTYCPKSSSNIATPVNDEEKEEKTPVQCKCRYCRDMRKHGECRCNTCDGYWANTCKNVAWSVL